MTEQILQQLIGWLAAGGATGLLTLILTTLITKSRKSKYIIDAKDEQIEALIQQMIDLKGIVFNLTEMFMMFFQTSKNIPTEIREKAEAHIVTMRKDFGFKIKESVAQAIALAKEKTLKQKEAAVKQLEDTKSEATKKIEGLRAIADEILSEEIKKN